MNREGIKLFLRELEVKQSAIKDEAEWVMSHCILAPWTHTSGKDSRASFGISVHEDDTSIFHCFTCHYKGTLTNLLERIEGFTGEDYSELKNQFGIGEELGPPLGDWTGRGGEKKEVLGEPLRPDYLKIYEWPGHYPEARKYLRKRGVEAETCKRLQVQYDPDERRILFPVFDPAGALYGFSGRAVDKDAYPKVKDYFGLPKRLLLLGSHLVQDARMIVVVEGLVDYAWMQQLGYPAVALMGTELTPGKAELLKNLGKPVYAFTDFDGPGFDAAYQIAKALIAHVPVFQVEYPEGFVEGDDPAKLSKAQAEEMIAGAELFDI